jgi:microcin C transport system substrate-binding protein
MTTIDRRDSRVSESTLVLLLSVSAALGVAAPAVARVLATQSAREGSAAQEPVTLPDGIVWETNMEDPIIGSPDAVRGGTINLPLGSYPLTFRLMGPNSNDSFAGWNRSFTMDFSLVKKHPVTGNFIPIMATHWSVQDDQRTIYYRLDPDARWSDGDPITADDYVFALEMWRSEYIVDPYYNQNAELLYESIDKIDDYTIRVVGTRPSWRPLWDYGWDIYPMPSHATVLDDTWVTRTNNEPVLAVGPYVVSEAITGESVTFERIQDWWGDDKRYFQGLFNVDRIHLAMVPEERMLDFLRSGDIDMIGEPTARTWNEQYNFPEVQNGWIRRARVFYRMPEGLYGLHMNLQAPIFQNKDFRKAMQYLFNFDRLNRNLMYNEYFRMVSFFGGTEYENPDLDPYPFDPIRAREHLEAAGYHRPEEIRSSNVFSAIGNVIGGLLLTRSNTDAILVNERGERASFELIYGGAALTRHLTVMQQEYRRAGVDIRLRMLEPGTAFERGMERKYEMTMTSRSAYPYPDPRQYFHTEYLASTNNNNIWGFGNAEVDSLIQVYEDDLDLEDRQAAMRRIDEIVQDEAIYIPFWSAPYGRIAHWDYVVFPEFYYPPSSDLTINHMTYWIDEDRRARLDAAMQSNTALPVPESLDVDFYGVAEGNQ